MQVNTNGDLQNSFKALADPTRRMILMHLSNRNMTIGEVSHHFDMTRAAVKKHLSILEKGKLISVHRKGREMINQLEPKGLKSVAEWMTNFNTFWDDRLINLRNAIESEKGNQNV